MDWVGTTDMDTMVSSFEDLIVEQCVRHNTKLKNFEGIAIDRLDYRCVCKDRFADIRARCM